MSANTEKIAVRKNISLICDELETQRKEVARLVQQIKDAFDRRKAHCDRGEYTKVVTSMVRIDDYLRKMNQWQNKRHDNELTDLKTSEEFRLNADRAFTETVSLLRSLPTIKINSNDEEEEYFVPLFERFEIIRTINEEKIALLKELAVLDKDIAGHANLRQSEKMIEALQEIKLADLENMEKLIASIKSLKKDNSTGIKDVIGLSADLVGLATGTAPLIAAIKKIAGQ